MSPPPEVRGPVCRLRPKAEEGGSLQPQQPQSLAESDCLLVTKGWGPRPSPSPIWQVLYTLAPLLGSR